MSILLKKALLSDADELFDMQVKAFKPILEKYQDYNTNPGAERIEKTISRLNEANSDYYFIRNDGKNIGAIRIIHHPDICKLKQIYILPEHQGKGYAQEAITIVESCYTDIKQWELDTIKQESKLCHLYEKMGYKQTGREETIKDGMTLVFYKK
jgi:RimJ/RimL family protein N-acetyltransferase